MENIPLSELERRWARVRALMKCDALLVAQNVDVFYLTGTLQNGLLWFPHEGEPLFAVQKSFQRAKAESPLRNIVPLKSYSDFAVLVPAVDTLGFELDVLPVSTYQRLAKLFPNSKLIDASMALRLARAVKTPFEVGQIRQAAHMLDLAFLDIPTQLHEGLAEYQLAARIEYVMRMAGHQGLSRVRRFNMEMHYGAVSFGDTAAHPHAFDGPVGVRGLYPAVPAMGSRKTLVRGEPVMVDVVGGCGGYIADGSRAYSLGPVPGDIQDTHTFILELNAWIEEQLRPGAIPSQIYAGVQQRVAKTPYGPHFMGAGENQVRFVAHGVGLELDEFPVIAPKFDDPLEPGVVLAVEPKIFFPGRGGAGVENTYVITENGCERLTLSPQEWVAVEESVSR